MTRLTRSILAMLLAMMVAGIAQAQERPRAREAGIVIGAMQPGPRNAIVDVPGVAVGHATVHEGTRLHTGVTAIVPHGGDLYRDRVPAAVVVGNGYGKLLGISQVQELGELETPILLTGTLNVWRVADALVTWMLEKPGMAEVRSLNAVVGETNDGFLSDIRARPLGEAHVRRALAEASTSNVEEGAVGAGAGTVAFGWKGGIGTASRRLGDDGGGYVVGVLVQANYGGDLTIAGVPMRGRLPDPQAVAAAHDARLAANARVPDTGDGSVMIVLATDAPLDARQLRRLASRALLGIGRTGSPMTNGSGDYVIAFSTAPGARHRADVPRQQLQVLANDRMTPLFQAAAEATEEAVLNALFKATTVRGHQGTVPALPLERVLPLLREAGAAR